MCVVSVQNAPGRSPSGLLSLLVDSSLGCFCFSFLYGACPLFSFSILCVESGFVLPPRQDEQATRMGLGTAIMGCKEDGKVKVNDLVEVSELLTIPLQPFSNDVI